MGLTNLDKVGDILSHKAGAGGAGSVTSVTAGDTTITVGGTAADPTIIVGTLVPGSNGVPTLAAADATITVGGTASARTVAVGTITPGSNGTIALGSSTPTTVSLSAPGAGSGSTAAKIDHSHDLSLSIAPAWTGVHTWTNASLPVQSTITDTANNGKLVAMNVRHQSSIAGVAGISTVISGWASNGVAGGATLAEAGRLIYTLRTITNGAEDGTIILAPITGGAVSPTLNVAWTAAGVLGCTTSLVIGTMANSGISTNNVTITTASNMVNLQSGSSVLGGFLFTGTVNTSGARSYCTFTPSANTGQTASTAIKGFDWQGYTKQWATGAGPAEQVEFNISAPTYAAVAASTFPLCSTVAIQGAPIAGTNMTITQPLAFHVQAGGARFDGNVGFYGVTPVAQATGGENITNSVTSGGTSGTIANFTDLTIYANDAAAIRNDIFQLARALKQDHDQLRALGFLT